MKPHVFSLFGLLLLLMTSGCLRSEHPLSAIRDVRPDPQLAGRWRSQDKAKQKKGAIRISFDERGMGRAEAVPSDPAHPEVIRFFVTRTAKNAFINLSGDGPYLKEYEFYRYRVSTDGRTMRLWSLRSDSFEEAIKTGRLKGKLNVSPSKKEHNGLAYTLLQAPSDQLLSFIESQPEKKIFQASISFEKVR